MMNQDSQCGSSPQTDKNKLHQLELKDTPPKFNIAPEKWWLEDYFPIGKAYFQGLF